MINKFCISRVRHSFPTRRSSDLLAEDGASCIALLNRNFTLAKPIDLIVVDCLMPGMDGLKQSTTIKSIGFANVKDRKSTRLNSSHLVISYAVFCLKK